MDENNGTKGEWLRMCGLVKLWILDLLNYTDSRMRNLKAFTLMEMLVAMIIGGIVVGICYFCYDVIYKQYHQYKTMNEKIVEASVLNGVLGKDFLQAKFITKEGNGISVVSKEPPIHYMFDQEYLVRKADETRDTFFVASFQLQLKFQNDVQDMEEGLVDELSFTTTFFEEKEESVFHFKKIYGADVLMEKENGGR